MDIPIFHAGRTGIKVTFRFLLFIIGFYLWVLSLEHEPMETDSSLCSVILTAVPVLDSWCHLYARHFPLHVFFLGSEEETEQSRDSSYTFALSFSSKILGFVIRSTPN